MIAAAVLRGEGRSSRLLAEMVPKRLRVRCFGTCGDIAASSSTIAATRRCGAQPTPSTTALQSPVLEFPIPGPDSELLSFRGRNRDHNDCPGANDLGVRRLLRPGAVGFCNRRWLTYSTSKTYFSSSSPASSAPNASDSGARTDQSHEAMHDISWAGAASFQRYTQTKQRIQDLRSEVERAKSIQLYKAWESAEGKAKEEEEERAGKAAAASSTRRGGVAVVKTLVRQVNEEARTQDRVLRQLLDLENEAQLLLEESALRHGHPQALLVLGNQCLEERGDPERAMELWKASCTGTGWFNVGHLLWTGYEPNPSQDSPSSDIAVPVDRAEAMRAFERAVELGDADAMYFVGVEKLSEESNESSAADVQSGVDCLERAAELGHGGAMYYLALLHLQGSDRAGIPPCGDAEFARRVDQACDVGQHPEAWFLRGHCFYRGDHSFPRRVRRALEDFLRAADAGHADAAVSAGALLFQGAEGSGDVSDDGVPRDRRRAFELYQHAGELGSLDGWRNVVACYATGQGVPQSLETAQYIARTMLPPEVDGPTDGSL